MERKNKPTMSVEETKELMSTWNPQETADRRDILAEVDGSLQKTKDLLSETRAEFGCFSRELALVNTKVDEAQMWLSKARDAIG